MPDGTADSRTRPGTSAGGGVLAVLALAAMAFSIAQTAVVPGVGILARDLRTTTENASWVLSAYLVSAAIMTPLVGRLGDMFGKRRMLLVALVLFTAGCVVAALSPSIWVLVAARVVQGAGGGIFPLCFGIINDTFPERRRPGAIGLIAATGGIGAGVGLIMGGLLLDHASWHWVFWAGAIMSGAAVLGTLRLPDAGVRAPGRVDVAGALLLAAGLTAPLIALTRTSAWGWLSARTAGLAAAGLVVLVLFGLYERRAAEPLVDVRLLARPTVLATNFATLLVGFGMFGAFVLIPQIAQTPEAAGYGFGLDATGAGLLLLPASLAMMAAGAASGKISLRFGSRTMLMGGLAVAAAGLGVLALEHGTEGGVLVLAVVVFAGIGGGMAAMPNIIVGAVPREKTGQATGVNALVRAVGSALGSQVVATLLSASTAADHPLPTDTAFTQAFWLGAGGILCAVLVGALIPRQRPAAARADTRGAVPAQGQGSGPGASVAQTGGDRAG